MHGQADDRRTLYFLSVLRRPWSVVLALLLSVLVFGPARAQLATSFYNVTSIQTRVLPNAVQITIRTDGAVLFGANVSEFLQMGPTRWGPKPITSFRLRLLRARSRLPAFQDIGAYPVDSAVVTLGADEFDAPFFNFWEFRPGDPRVDIEFRFYVPVRLQRFIVDKNARSSIQERDEGENSIVFGEFLNPLDIAVEIGPDRRSIVLTVLSDRVDTGKAARLRRSPPETHNRRLQVTAGDDGRFRIDALHTRLPQLLDAFSLAAKLPMTARADATDIDVSLLLPAVTPEEFLHALATGYGLNVTPRPAGEGGGFSVGRNGLTSIMERLPLRHLPPEAARLLFPDFLLPLLHADVEQNALLVSGAPELVARIRRDLEKLDRPRPQVRVEVAAWEFSSVEDAALALDALVAHGEGQFQVKTGTGEMALRVEKSRQRAFTATVQTLVTKGRARLAARPFVVVASGTPGTLFLGQQRYVTVLQGTWRQEVQALRLQIGYSLTVQPTLGAQDDVTLELNPRISTVDAVEAGTGLPTLSIRETTSVVRLRSGDAVLVGGMESASDDRAHRRLSPLARLPLIGGLFVSRRSGLSRTATLLLVTARKES